MTAKRAFIVDDSRSARVILSRMLESYGMQVESAESGEQALEYLQQSRPDVIFMDHLMPGMDGFQAIQAIKSNPHTATIPVIMYTSQEGELYVSQARALGAVGVLPKTVKQADVSRVLYQLRLLPERREGKSQLIAGAAAENASVRHEAGPATSMGELELAVRRAVATALKEQTSELRRFYLASFEAFARRLIAEIKSNASTTPSPPAEVQAMTPPEPEATPNRSPWLAAAAVIALLPTAILAVLFFRNLEVQRAQNESYSRVVSALSQQQTQLASLQKALQRPAVQSASAGSLTLTEDVETESVPYGEIPLAGARVDKLRTLVDELRAGDFNGTLKVRTFAADFCLTGNAVEGYSVAADELPVKRCDLIGNPYDDNLSAAQRQSLAFANLVSSLRQQSSARITVEVVHEGRKPVVPYPSSDRLARITAGEWNRIAAQNSRVEFVAEPSAVR